MDYDYNKLFADFYGRSADQDLNDFDRSYDPDDFSDYEEFDDPEPGEIEDFDLQHVAALNLNQLSHQPALEEPTQADIERALEQDTLQMKRLADKFFALEENFFDNVDFRPVPSPLYFTTEEKNRSGPLLETLDKKEECTQSELRGIKNDIKDKNGPLFQTITFLQHKMKDENNFEADSIFSQRMIEFFKNFNGWNFETKRIEQFRKLKQYDPDDQYIKEILNYQELEPKDKKQLFIVYGPSGGGKTTFYKKHKQFLRILEVDDLVKDNYDSFLNFRRFVEYLGNGHEGIMNLWFKYHLDVYYHLNKLDNVLLLFNHPNQMPNYFRQKFNELIILPKKLNWNLRFFDENYFSLASVLGKHKVILDYNEYFLYILKFFKLNFSSRNLKFIRKLPDSYKRKITDIIYSRSAPKLGSTTRKRKITTVSAYTMKRNNVNYFNNHEDGIEFRNRISDKPVNLDFRKSNDFKHKRRK